MLPGAAGSPISASGPAQWAPPVGASGNVGASRLPMQLSLLSRTAPSSSEARTGPSTVPGAWRDSAMSQLDTLAAANERVALQSLPGRALAAGGLLLAVVLGAALLWPSTHQPVLAKAGASTPTAVSSLTVTPAMAIDPVPVAAASVPDPALIAPATDDAPLPGVLAEDEEARKARAVRRKAMQLAQERERADEDARRQMQALAAQREDAERTRQEQAQRQLADAARERAAAEQSRRQAVSIPAATPAPVRRGVADQCAGSGGLASEQACHARACWRAEHRADPVCVQLREAEALRQQRGTEH